MAELNPDQFLYHGTARPIEGDKILPAKVHGKGSYWHTAGESRGEPANEHAWAHPDENKVWEMAHDRVVHTHIEDDWNPRARVFAVKPNEHQSPGHDTSIPGEVKAPHFDISHPIDTMPGRQGTFPEVNWNTHVMHMGNFSENEDANHPSNLSVQFGHRAGKQGWSEDTPAAKDSVVSHLQARAREEGMNRYLDRQDAVAPKVKYVDNREQPLPGMSNERQFTRRGR